MGMHGSGYFWMPSKELSLLLVSASLSHSPGQSGRPCHHPCLTSKPKSSERQGDFPQSLEYIQNSDSLPSSAILIFNPWIPCLSRARTLPVSASLFLQCLSCSSHPHPSVLSLCHSHSHHHSFTHILSHTRSDTPAQCAISFLQPLAVLTSPAGLNSFPYRMGAGASEAHQSSVYIL